MAFIDSINNAQLTVATLMRCDWRRPWGARGAAKMRRQELFAIYLADTKRLPKSAQPDLVNVHRRLNIEAKVGDECSKVLHPSVMATGRI